MSTSIPRSGIFAPKRPNVSANIPNQSTFILLTLVKPSLCLPSPDAKISNGADSEHLATLRGRRARSHDGCSSGEA